MKKLFIFIIYFITGLVQASSELVKPECRVFSKREFKLLNEKEIHFKSYDHYLFSRKVKRENKETFALILQNDIFTYPKFEKWLKKTEWLNAKRPEDVEIYLPPCLNSDEQHLLAKLDVLRPKVVKKMHRLTYQGSLSTGLVNVKSDDELNSKFELRFFKLSGLIQYALKSEFFFFGGLGVNNYYQIKFKSSNTTQESNQINSYLDTFVGLRVKKENHHISLQYDNMNYFLNESDASNVNLNPTRVDRISIQESYSFWQKYFLLGSLGVYHPLFSKASGYDFGLGGGVRLDSHLSLSLIYSQNKINKNKINNTSDAYVLGARYIF